MMPIPRDDRQCHWFRLRQRWPPVEDVFWQVQGRTFAGKRGDMSAVDDYDHAPIWWTTDNPFPTPKPKPKRKRTAKPKPKTAAPLHSLLTQAIEESADRDLAWWDRGGPEHEQGVEGFVDFQAAAERFLALAIKAGYANRPDEAQ